MPIYKINIPNKPEYHEIELDMVKQRLSRATIGDKIVIEIVADEKDVIKCPACGEKVLIGK